jgi:hypothetical protein
MSTRVVETLGEIRSDWLIDLVASEDATGLLKLLYWDGQEAWIRRTIEMKQQDGTTKIVYHPKRIDPTLQRAIHFPTRAIPYESTAALLDALTQVIKQFSPLDEPQTSLLGYVVLASWLAEFTPTPINLAIVGAAGPERRQLLLLLRCLLRRALTLGEATVEGVCSLPLDLAPTLIIERCEPTTQFQRLLELTNSRDAQIIIKGRLLNASCSKVVCGEESWGGSVPGWPALEIALPLAPRFVPVLTVAEQQRIKDEFQPKLQMFRLQNHKVARESMVSLYEVPETAREMASTLVAGVAADERLTARLAEPLKKHFLASGRQSELQNEVITVLLAVSHENKATVSVAEVTSRLNQLLEHHGQLLVLQPRAVGSILRTLGFPTQRLGSSSRGMTLLNSVKQRIHELASARGILTGYSHPACDVCLRLDPQYLDVESIT